jgi:hypothetical protein
VPESRAVAYLTRLFEHPEPALHWYSDSQIAQGLTLGLESLACQESALHGLGHWQRDHDPRVNAIIDGFLEANPGVDARFIVYANSARCGCVL